MTRNACGVCAAANIYDPADCHVARRKKTRCSGDGFFYPFQAASGNAALRGLAFLHPRRKLVRAQAIVILERLMNPWVRRKILEIKIRTHAGTCLAPDDG